MAKNGRKTLNLPSDVGVDYTELCYLLAATKWKEADHETRRLILFIAGAHKRTNCLLTEKDIEKFPCTDLQTLDLLWTHYSKGRFGFSIIKGIYEQVGQDYTQLAQIVGWQVDNRWLNYNELIFDYHAPVGHLPMTWIVPITLSSYWLSRFASAGWKRMLSRMAVCELKRSQNKKIK